MGEQEGMDFNVPQVPRSQVAEREGVAYFMSQLQKCSINRTAWWYCMFILILLVSHSSSQPQPTHLST